MAAMDTITLKDDSATPVVWTFVPVTDTPFPQWRTVDATKPLIGQARLSLESTKLKNGGYKVTAKLEVPTLEAITATSASGYAAVPKVAFTTTGICTFFIDARTTTSDRVNALRMLTGLLTGASAAWAGADPNFAAGNAFKSATGPYTALMANMVLPN